ncbi:MAG TPA: M3 family oligoendopeptidase [Gemmataceae bacterium]|jgi:oligoendopeptidase F|nr:M3 family oligoendopeptidase [Gemmataceae bacterium]
MNTAAPAAPTKPSSSADGVTWNLQDLYAAIDDPRIEQDLEAALQRAQAFEKAYRGKIECAAGPQPALLRSALEELESLSEQMDRPAIFASLAHAAKTDEPSHGALVARTRERRAAINKSLIFFDLEWVKVPDEQAQLLLDSPQLSRYRHFLEQKRAWKPHYLTEPEEKILEEKSVTGRAAFVRLFDESVANITFPFVHESISERVSLQQVSARLYDANRSVRKAAAAGITKGLQENARLLTYLFNNLVLDHQADSRLRHFEGPMDSRNLANEITPAAVNALMTAVERHHATVHRYYRLKGKLLGLDQLQDYDRYAPLASDLPTCDWQQARRLVQEGYDAFSPKVGGIVREFFDRRWIDAALRPGKRSGAFSSSAVPSAHPFILMNYTDKMRDVMTLAHELGHGIHQYLSRGMGYLQCDTPLTTAEMASIFGEMLIFDRLQEVWPDPHTRLALLCSKIDDSFATVFRQVVLTRFEQKLHAARQDKGELTTEQINALWIEANKPMHSEVVQLTEGYGWWWMYIGHFIHVPFYCYAYSFGELLVFALVQKYKQEGSSFVPRYIELLSAGGSDKPDRLLAKLDIDVTDPEFWELGLRLLDEMVSKAEKLAEQVKM